MAPLAKHINCPPLHISSSPLEVKALHDQFVALGRQRNKLTYQLLELLPAIFERKIYQKYGCATIEEYAGRFAGLPKSVVKKRLRLERNLADKPALKALVGTEGVHKVALVAHLATASTDCAWADKVQNMSKAGLETLAKEMREHLGALTKGPSEKRTSYCIAHTLAACPSGRRAKHSSLLDVSSSSANNTSTGNVGPTFCSAASEKITIELTGELLFLFLKMKKRFETNLSYSEALKKMLEELEALLKSENAHIRRSSVFLKDGHRNKQEKTNIEAKSDLSSPCEMKDEKGGRTAGQESRYIPISLRKMALTSTGGRCAYPNCQHPYELFHHRERFFNHKSHASIIPLCKKHHEFMHNGLIVHEKSDPEKWTIEISDQRPLSFVDERYRE